MSESSEARDEAKAHNATIAKRLAELDTEISAMKAQAETLAAQEEAQSIERSEQEALRIRDQAERTIRDETPACAAQLRAHAVELAVQLAEATLRKDIAADDQRALANAFLASVQDRETQHG